MRLIAFIKLCIAMLVIYISLGDMFLPEPYSQNSKRVRHNINHYLVSFWAERKLLNF